VLKFNILLILLAVRFTIFWHCHRIMTHFWSPAVHSMILIAHVINDMRLHSVTYHP